MRSCTLACHRHQMRAARIIRPSTRLTTMMETLTSVEGWWVNRASTTTWNTHQHHRDIKEASPSPGGCGGWVWGSHLGERLPPDQDGVGIFLAGVEHGHRALDLHDAVATLRQTG